MPPERGSGAVAPVRTLEAKLHEAENLADSLGLEVVCGEGVRLSKINPATLIGGGKVDELKARVADDGVEVVVVDAGLSPRQQRNLEVGLQAKVLDRTGLILEIFASRARTRAGKLQVELARQTYMQSRLVRQWTHLERQRGGTGKASGPGERQLDLDRTMIKTRIGRLKAELADVAATRNLQRVARQRAQIPTVALVGYTNAGKSTLFNRVVEAGTLVADALFATLDPLMRRFRLPGGLEIVLADTVGFVADLPHELVEAFKATLEEVVMADLLLEVRDASNPDWRAQAADVDAVLREIGAADKPRVVAFNKVDRLADGVEVPEGGLGVSAVSGEGVDNLLAALEAELKQAWQVLEVRVPASDGKRLAWLYAHGDVLESVLEGEEWRLNVRLRAEDVGVWEKDLILR
ncbi:MAG: GTPase HflX [Pseudomonadaceae bacterium]|nr:GTPase HflX [Pseudomonadaceae bacterium]